MTQSKLPKKLRIWCEANSNPKPWFRPPKIKRGPKLNLKKAKNVERINIISQPTIRKAKQHNWPDSKLFCVRKGALKYKATKRIIEIAAPNQREAANHFRDPTLIKDAALKHITSIREWEMSQPRYVEQQEAGDSSEVKESALSYNASPRIIEISKPPKLKITKKYKYQKPEYVKKSALKATASPRVTELSKPHKWQDNTKPNPFGVKKGALKYVATANICKISKPRRITPKYRNPEDRWKYRFVRYSIRG